MAPSRNDAEFPNTYNPRPPRGEASGKNASSSRPDSSEFMRRFSVSCLTSPICFLLCLADTHQFVPRARLTLDNISLEGILAGGGFLW